MSDRTTTIGSGAHQVQVHPARGSYADNIVRAPQRSSGPTATQVLAVVTLLPVGGTLLAVAALTLVGTLVGLALATPLFLLASPILVPAVFLLGLAVAGFMSSGAFGLTGLSSLSWVLNSFREKLPDSMDYAKQRLQDTVDTLGQKTKETGEKIQSKAHEIDTGAGKDTTATQRTAK